eukprot:scaffold167143_cov27-Tisochrysis_lutea.AAC.2
MWRASSRLGPRRSSTRSWRGRSSTPSSGPNQRTRGKPGDWRSSSYASASRCSRGLKPTSALRAYGLPDSSSSAKKTSPKAPRPRRRRTRQRERMSIPGVRSVGRGVRTLIARQLSLPTSEAASPRRSSTAAAAATTDPTLFLTGAECPLSVCVM